MTGLVAFLRRPAVAFPLVCAVYVLGLHLGRGVDLPRLRATPLAGGDPKVLYVLGCGLFLTLARRFPRHRDAVHVALGTAWLAYAVGWPYVVATTALGAAVHFGLRSFSSHEALILSVLAALLVYGRLLPWLHVDTAAAWLLSIKIPWVTLRTCLYAFELKAIRKADRSFLRFLSYGPLGLLLTTGDPALLSYTTFATSKPQRELDAMGASQLYRSAWKFLLLVVSFACMRRLLPTATSLLDLSAPQVVAALFLLYWSFFLELSIAADATAGLSNLAGYHAPSAFQAPLLAWSPFDFWRRWNVHVLDVIRRVFIFPVARHSRRMTLIVVVGMLGSVVIHAVAVTFAQGSAIRAGGSLDLLYTFTIQGLFLVAFIPLEQRVASWGPLARGVAIGVSQLLIAATMVGNLGGYYRVVTAQQSRCLLVHTIAPTFRCTLGSGR